MPYAYEVSGPTVLVVGDTQYLTYEITETDVEAASEWSIPAVPAIGTVTLYEVAITDAGAIAAARVAPEIGYSATFGSSPLERICEVSQEAQPGVSRAMAARFARMEGGALYGRSRATDDGAAPGTPVPEIVTRITLVPGHNASDEPVLTDRSSFLVKAAGVFAVPFAYSNAIDMRDYDEVTVWLVVTSIAGVTSVDVVVEWTDDGTTIAPDGTATQRSDDNIASGVFNPYPYTARFTVASGTLTTGKLMLSFPKKGGSCRIGVKGDAQGGNYSIRAQRLAS
jgi:hypothetical protein